MGVPLGLFSSLVPGLGERWRFGLTRATGFVLVLLLLVVMVDGWGIGETMATFDSLKLKGGMWRLLSLWGGGGGGVWGGGGGGGRERWGCCCCCCGSAVSPPLLLGMLSNWACVGRATNPGCATVALAVLLASSPIFTSLPREFVIVDDFSSSRWSKF